MSIRYISPEIEAKVAEIFAASRARFGDDAFRMEATAPPPTESPAAAPTPPEVQNPSAEPAVTPEAPAASANPWEDPKSAQAEIERLRRENAKDRTNAKAQAAADAQKELANTIGKALGLVPDGAETDPAKLTESLTAAQNAARQSQVELAVFKAASAAGGDPVALLDSSSFLASLAAVDPSDSAAVAAAIQSAVTANPRLGAASADPVPPAPNPAQGASANGVPTERAKSLGEALEKRLQTAR